MAEFHFDCVFHYVSDMERAISFYSEVLGLRLTSRDVVARFDIDGVLFELVPGRDERNVRGGGNARLCLKVDDISQAVEYLKMKGAHAGEIRKVENGKLVPFEDPDRNEIYLWQYDWLRRIRYVYANPACCGSELSLCGSPGVHQETNLDLNDDPAGGHAGGRTL